MYRDKTKLHGQKARQRIIRIDDTKDGMKACIDGSRIDLGLDLGEAELSSYASATARPCMLGA